MDFHSLYQLRKSIRNPNKKKKRESSNWNTFLLSYICWVPTYRVDRRSVGTNLNKCKKRNVLEDSGFRISSSSLLGLLGDPWAISPEQRRMTKKSQNPVTLAYGSFSFLSDSSGDSQATARERM